MGDPHYFGLPRFFLSGAARRPSGIPDKVSPRSPEEPLTVLKATMAMTWTTAMTSPLVFQIPPPTRLAAVEVLRLIEQRSLQPDENGIAHVCPCLAVSLLRSLLSLEQLTGKPCPGHGRRSAETAGRYACQHHPVHESYLSPTHPCLNDFCTAGVLASGQRTSIGPPLPELEAPFLTSLNEASFILPNSSWNTFSGSKRHLCGKLTNGLSASKKQSSYSLVRAPDTV